MTTQTDISLGGAPLDRRTRMFGALAVLLARLSGLHLR